jgi:hypothetical protein
LKYGITKTNKKQMLQSQPIPILKTSKWKWVKSSNSRESTRPFGAPGHPSYSTMVTVAEPYYSPNTSPESPMFYSNANTNANTMRQSSESNASNASDSNTYDLLFCGLGFCLCPKKKSESGSGPKDPRYSRIQTIANCHSEPVYHGPTSEDSLLHRIGGDVPNESKCVIL